eukprot:10570816-Alexandrium_andersonii.AAC.1
MAGLAEGARAGVLSGAGIAKAAVDGQCCAGPAQGSQSRVRETRRVARRAEMGQLAHARPAPAKACC